MPPAVIHMPFKGSLDPPIAMTDDYWLTANEIRVMLQARGGYRVLWELAPRYRKYEPLSKTEVIAE